MAEETLKKSRNGGVWLIGIISVAVIVLIILIASFYFPAAKTKNPAEANSGTEVKTASPVNASFSVRSSDWCTADTAITIDKLPGKDGEKEFRILTTRVYNGELVCYVKNLINNKEYYFNKDYTKIYQLTKNQNAGKTEIAWV